MSSRSSFREQLDRPEKPQAELHGPSAFPVEVRIEPGKTFQSPVSLAMLLRDHGLGLKGGHAAVTEMAANRHVIVTVLVSNVEDFIRRLAEMGLEARAAHNAVGR